MWKPTKFVDGFEIGAIIGLPFAFLLYGSFDYWGKTTVLSLSFWPFIFLFSGSIVMTIISGISERPIFRKAVWIDGLIYGFVLIFDVVSIGAGVMSGHF